jgi:hypothetical protein
MEQSTDVIVYYLKVGDGFSHGVIRRGDRLYDVLLMSCHFSSNPIIEQLGHTTNRSTFNLTRSNCAGAIGLFVRWK